MITRNISGNLAPNEVAPNYATAASDTAVVITLAAKAGQRHMIHGLQWSYTGGTPAGSITVENGSGTTIFSCGITASGPGGFMAFLRGSINTAMIITLAAGGVSIVGKLNIQATTEPG
jgi:hypothetical protein